jgi:hypothetical protein
MENKILPSEKTCPGVYLPDPGQSQYCGALIGRARGVIRPVLIARNFLCILTVSNNVLYSINRHARESADIPALRT